MPPSNNDPASPDLDRFTDEERERLIQPQDQKKQKRSGCLVVVNYALVRLGAALILAMLVYRAVIPAAASISARGSGEIAGVLAIGFVASGVLVMLWTRHR